MGPLAIIVSNTARSDAWRTIDGDAASFMTLLLGIVRIAN
jgi:hypothetical protein